MTQPRYLSRRESLVSSRQRESNIGDGRSELAFTLDRRPLIIAQRKHFDWILWFQVGDFYELYEQDCDWAEREFGLKVLRQRLVYLKSLSLGN